MKEHRRRNRTSTSCRRGAVRCSQRTPSTLSDFASTRERSASICRDSKDRRNRGTRSVCPLDALKHRHCAPPTRRDCSDRSHELEKHTRREQPWWSRMEPSFTTTISKSGKSCASALSSVALSVRSALYAGTTTETSGIALTFVAVQV